MWNDEQFVKTNLETKVLFNYLINCESLGLSRFHRLTDRQIMFDTNLNFNQLETGKQELTNIKWCFFKSDWIYHNHDCAYVSYEGRDRVRQSKEKEIESVPVEIIEYFNPLITRYELVLNYKSEILNTKSKTGNDNLTGYEPARNQLEETANRIRKRAGSEGKSI